jgi:diguanylate cyclase (GGDEF)-like protein/PAS domain S-box-containing protein
LVNLGKTGKGVYIVEFSKSSLIRIVDNLHDGLYVVNREREIQYWNKAAERISGFSAQEVTGHSCFENILTHVDADGNSLCLTGCPLEKTMKDEKSREVTVFMHHKDGHRIPVSVRTSPLHDQDGKIIGGIELFSDISQQQANELRIQELEKMAMLDNLTQLANRNYLEKEIQSRFEEFQRFEIPFGLLFMDIDHFKSINDTYGHDMGDRILKFVADTLTHNARPFDLFGRWGGEEFIGVLRNITNQNLERVGNRIRLLVENSYIAHENEKLHVTISIGATLVRKNDNSKGILKRADQLLYRSKESGRNCLTID